MSDPQTKQSSSLLRPGDKLDKFEILAQVGAGGMSTVWRGYDRLLDRFVAIKQLHLEPGADGQHENLVEKCRNEVTLQKRVSANHKSLVRVYDFIHEPRGMFIIMEFVDGPTLEQLIASAAGPMDQRQALGILGAAALALGAIHSRGVVHRDLKPSNILLPPGGLKICDFGLAALMEEQEALTAGSVRYMAPELFTNDNVDGRADLYALGMIAYEMLAGRPKFEDAFKMVLRDQRNQPMRWMKWHTNQRVVAPALHELNPQVPRRLSELVARLMEKDRDKRIGSGDELIAAIRRHFAAPGEPDASSHAAEAQRIAAMASSSAGESTAPLPRKPRLPWILAGVAAALVVVGVGLVGFKQWQTTNAVSQKRDAAMAEYSEAQDRFNRRDYSPELRERFAQLAQRWSAAPDIQRGCEAHVLFLQGYEAHKAGRYAEAIARFEESDRLNVLDPNLVHVSKTNAITQDAIGKAKAEIEARIEAGDFDQARLLLTSLEELSRVDLNDADREWVRETGVRIESKRAASTVDRTLRAAEADWNAGRQQDAYLAIERANERNPTREYQAILTRWDLERQYDRLLVEYEQARRDGRAADAITIGQKLQRVRDEPARAAQIKGLQGKEAFDRGVAALAVGRLDDARNAFREALSFDPDNSQAKSQLEAIKSANERQQLVDSGDAAMAENAFDKALGYYRQANVLSPDDSVKTKIAQAEVQSLLQQARTLMDEGRIDDARNRYIDVLQRERDNAAARSGIMEVDRIADYRTKIEAADRLRRDGRNPEAIRRYREAQKIMDTPEVRARLEEANYQNLVATAWNALKAQDLSSASAWVAQLEREFADKDEVKRLRAELDKLAADKPKQP